MNLNIHSIESFGTVDGPGIRYVIFAQGCPLRCQYCHNPDTWNKEGGKTVEIEDLLHQIDDLKEFLAKGGVTVTGGEPLMQANKIKHLFKALKQKGIHTCLDTSGCIPINSDIEELLEYTDLVMLDIKVMDEEKHKVLTGTSNKNILEFTKTLDQKGIPIWVRHVLLPTINDSQEDLHELKSFVDSLDNLYKIEVLPYHELGIYKWDKLGLEYKLKHITPPTKPRVEEVKSYLRSK